jgi:hypothetical protein
VTAKRKADFVTSSAAERAEGERSLLVENYDKVVARAHLRTVRLSNVTFKVNDRLGKQASLFYQVAVSEPTFDQDNGVATIKLRCEAGVRAGKQRLVDCKAIFVVVYEGLEGCDQNAVGRFISRVGKFTGYPYFRSLFAVLTWEAQTAMPPLPVLKEPRRPHKIENNAGSAKPTSLTSMEKNSIRESGGQQ